MQFAPRGTVPRVAGGGGRALPSVWQRLFTVATAVVLLSSGLDAFAPARLATAASQQPPPVALSTGGPADPIPYENPTDGGGDGTAAIATDPSVAKRPDFAPPVPPGTKTALKDQWTANRRVFANPDGTFTLQSGTAINFRPPSGDWTALDLSLVSDDTTHFHPSAAPSNLALASGSGDGGFATLTGLDGSVTLRALGYGAGGKFGNQLKFVGTNGSPDVFVQPTDMGFEFGATFSAATVGPGANFVLDPGALAVALGGDGRTVFFSSGVDENGKPLIVGSISAPTLLDGTEAVADPTNLAVSLTARGDGSYLLTYTVSASWLHAAGRVFPVTVDPTACIRSGGGGSCTNGTNTDDIWYGSGQPSSFVTSSTSSNDHVGYYRATGDPWAQTRAVLWFDGVSLADGAVVTGATLTVEESNNYSGATTANIMARMGTKGWSIDTSSATWNNLNAAANASYDSPIVHPCNTGATDCALTLDVAKAVRAWYTRTGADWKANAGFQVRYQTEGTTSPFYETAFYRYTNATVTNRPLLTITYELGGFGIDFDPNMGATYAPTKMVAGSATILPVTVTNKSGFVLDTTNYKVGYRFFDVKGKNTGVPGLANLPLALNPGDTSSVIGLSVTPPTTPGQYTLRLDVVKVVNGVNVYYSDWGLPTLFYSRNKKVLTSDSTRWVGSSVMERDEFSITVGNGQGTGGDDKAIGVGGDGQAAIDLASRNLSLTGDSGLAVKDQIPLSVSYGYNSKDAATCSGYLGVLKACGWFTNWDERVTAGGTDGAYSYFDTAGNSYLTDSDFDGQLVGAPNQLSRIRVTMFDENRPSSGGTLVTAASQGIPAKSGPNVIKASSVGTVVLGGFVDGAAGREISLNTFRNLNFSIRTTTASIKVELCAQLDDKTNGASKWFCIEPNSDWDSSHDRAWYGSSPAGNWVSLSIDLWGVASGAVGGFSTLGKTTDDYFVKSIELIGDPANTGSTFLDAVSLTPSRSWSIASPTVTNWTSGSSVANSTETPDIYLPSQEISAPVTCTGTCMTDDAVTEVINGTGYQTIGSLAASPFFSWWWKKAGGTAAIMTLTFKDLRQGSDGGTGYKTGTITYYADAQAPIGAVNPVQVSSHIPGHFSLVTRNILEDSRQILGFYKDADLGATSASPPTSGPTPDEVQWTGLTIDPVDGQYLLFQRIELNSSSRRSTMNRFADWESGRDALNYSGIEDSGGLPLDDFVAENSDGTSHYFNRDGLLTRILTKEEAELDLDWTYGASYGQSNYSLTTVHAPSDNTDNGASIVYRHKLVVSASANTPSGFTQTSFTEQLGSVATPITGRRADFYVATATGATWGIGDLVRVSPARHNTTTCGTHSPSGSGCVEFEYTATTGHLVKLVADPRWDGSIGTANDARFEVTWTAGDPMAILDRSHASMPVFRVLNFDRGRATSPLYVRALYQDSAALGANYALHEDETPDGAVATTYIRQACGGSDCFTSGNWPAGDAATLAPRVAMVHAFDGVNHVTKVTTYRCPAVSAFGCTGTTALASVTRQGTNAGAKVDNYIDALAGAEVAWSQTADQYFASLRDSASSNEDLYRTEYTYNAVHEPIVTRTPVLNRVTDYPGAMTSTEGLTDYWRMNDAGTPLHDSVPGGHDATGTSLTYGQPGPLARDANNKSVGFNGSTSNATSPVTFGSTAYTVEAWVKAGTPNQVAKGIVSRYLTPTGVLLYLDGNGHFSLVQNGGTYIASPLAPVAGRWYYLAGTWDGSRIRLYVDGDLVAQGPSAAPPGAGSSSLEIGSYGNGAAITFFNGNIDEVAIRSLAIDQSVVRAHFMAGRGVASIRTETTYGWISSTYHLDADPHQTATQLATNGDLEEGLNGWNTNHGAVLKDHTTDPSFVAYDGAGSVMTSGTNFTDQLVQAVPGQRIHFQIAGRTDGGSAIAAYKVESWSISSASWQTLIPEDTIPSTTWLVHAYEYTVPLSDTTGLLKVTLRNSGGTGNAYFDAVLLVTSWQAWTYLWPHDSSLTGTAYIGDGLVETTKAVTAQGAIRTDKQSFASDASHQATYPTKVIANYIDGTQGPAADQDVTTNTTLDSWGRPLTTTDPDLVTTTSVYDTTNLTDLVQVQDGLHQPTNMTYDLVGNLLTSATPLGRVTTSTYDFLNHKVMTTAPDGTKTRTDYDNYGRVAASWSNYVNGVVESSDQDLSDDVLTTFGHDAYGRVTLQDVDCGSIATCATGGLDARTTTTYDLLGNAVSSTVYPSSGGTGSARTTTIYFETYGSSPTYTRTSASGTQLAISPTALPAPLCPGSGNRCNSAATWLWNGIQTSGVDMNGRTYATTDAYGIVSLTDADLTGQPVQATSNYLVAGGHGTNNDQNVVTTTQYDLAGDVIAATDPLGRSDTKSYDALGRVLAVTQLDSTGVTVSSSSAAWLPSGRADWTNDGSSTTKTLYDAAGRATRTIANWDPTGKAGMTIDAFESGADGWSALSSGFFTTGAAGMATETDAAGNTYKTQAPFSGRGRLDVTTDSVNTVDGAWLNLSGPTYQSSHAYKVAFDLLTSNGTALRAFLGQDQSGGSYTELAGGITGDGTWHRYAFSWTPSANISTPVHFAVRKDAAGTAFVYLDNVVVWDTTAGWSDKGIVSSETAYNIDGQVITSVLPPGDPTTERPLVSTVAYDPAGRTVMSVVNDTTGAYPAAVKATTGVAAYFALDELTGLLATDQQGGTALVATGASIQGVAGGVDEARTAYRFTGLNGFLARTTNVTSAIATVGMEAWIRTDVTPAATTIIASNGTTADGWGLAIDSSGHAAGFTQKTGTGFLALATSTVVTDGGWHHLVLSRDATTWTLTIDGVASTPTNSSSSPGTPGAGFQIGAWSDGSRAFVGDIDEVSVYTANIGPSAAAHYAAGRRSDAVTELTRRTNVDRLGRPTDAWAPDLIRNKAAYDRLGNQIDTWANYRNGVTSGPTGDDDVHSTFAYDVVGELLGYCPAKQVQLTGCDPSSGANNQAWHYTYDQLGRKTKEVPPVNSVVAALNTTETVYDLGGRVSKTCTYPAAGSCAGTTNTHHTDVANTDYDGLGRPLVKKVYDRSTGSDVLKVTTTLTYNLDSTPNSIAENGDTLTYFYDLRGRPSQLKNGATVLTAWTYTPLIGTVASRTDGTVGTTTFTYDWANRATGISPPATYVAGSITRTYRLDGNLASQNFPSSITETLSYDAAKRPLSISLGSSGSISQTFDRAGRITTDARSLTGISGDPGTNTQTFAYDGLGRVTGSSGLAAGTTLYTYDLDGNRLSKTEGGVATTYTYDGRGDQLYQQVISGLTKTFGYDAFGNLTSAYGSPSSNLTSYVYDALNRVTSITPASGSAATFTLDALGRPKSRTVGSAIDNYGYLGTTPTSFETGSGASITDALLDQQGSRLAVKTGSSVAFALFDLHGSLVALCPSGGTTITTAYRYDPWGKTILAAGSITNPWRYRGMLDVSPDTNSPVYEMGARLYDPGLGVFTTEDSVEGKAADPLSMNRYLYAEADPTTLIDPDGHSVSTTTSGGCTLGYEDCAAANWTSYATNHGQQVLAQQRAEHRRWLRRQERLDDLREQAAMRRIHRNAGPEGCTIRKLNCSLGDFNQMSVSERIGWVHGLTETYGKERGFKDWFNNVNGILGFSREKGLMKSGSWESWVDASILQGFTSGLSAQLGLESPSQTGNPGTLKWQKFFAARAKNAPVEDSLELWGDAEQTSTDNGIAVAAGKGTTADPRVYKVLITFGNAYRAALKDPTLRDRLGHDLGWVIGEGEGRTFGSALGPLGSAVGGFAGGAAFARLGMWATPGLIDPRGMMPTSNVPGLSDVPWSQILSTTLYDWNP